MRLTSGSRNQNRTASTIATIASVAQNRSAASVRMDHRARERYRPRTVSTSTQVMAYSAVNATGSGTIGSQWTCHSAPKRRKDVSASVAAASRPSVSMSSDRNADPWRRSMAGAAYGGVVRRRNGTDALSGVHRRDRYGDDSDSLGSEGTSWLPGIGRRYVYWLQNGLENPIDPPVVAVDATRISPTVRDAPPETVSAHRR